MPSPESSAPPAPVSHTVAPTPQPVPSAAPAPEHPPARPPTPIPAPSPKRKSRLPLLIIVLVILAGVGYLATPEIETILATVSTDDAYVNGHATFVAPRVSGQVSRVLVDDNNRVRAGDLLVQLDKEPLQRQVNISLAAVTAAEADLATAITHVRALEGRQRRSLRYGLQTAIEDVDNRIALLHSRVATLASERASVAKAQADYDRGVPLLTTNTITPEEMDRRKESLLVARAEVEEALQGVYQIRVSLGLPPKPESGDDLTQVPDDLDQTFSAVKQAQASLMQAAAQIGVYEPFSLSPKEMIADFYKRDPEGNIDRIYAQILKTAPEVVQAQAKLLQAQRNLEQNQLNLSYCDVYATIDGVITRRDVNPGNNVVAGQSIMVIRSLTDIWVDANFKETQLRNLRIGQAVDLDVDMYGRHQLFKGRISGFTVGTGSTLSLLPAENATGNFVKVVQRLPVRIDLIDYDPDKGPLFLGLSVTPHVWIKKEPTGPDAGKVLQPYLAIPVTTAPSTAPETRP